MRIKKKRGAPFGINTLRFLRIGFHPNLDITGAMKKPTVIGPGEYNPKFVECRCSKPTLKQPWKNKQDLEEFSKTLGYRNAELLRFREEEKKKRGPGTIDINEAYYKKCSFNAFDDLSFGKQYRFPKHLRNLNPGPGSYGKNHIPHLKLEESHYPTKKWTHLPPFEWDGFVDRFRIGRIKPSASVPPNRYNIKSSCIEKLLAKKVSKRGPYDLFTGPRDDTTIKGYFAPPAYKGSATWPTSLPSYMDRLKDKSKVRYGCFLQCKRFQFKYNTNPAPGTYTINSPAPVKTNKYPFNQSKVHCRGQMRWEILPGVGRYNVKDNKCGYTVRESYPFKSKAKREFFSIITYNSF